MNLMSESLMRTVQVNAIVPFDKIQMPDQIEKANIKIKDYKVLYLLHGIYGSHVDWVNGTKLQRWAEEKNIVVIMPAGENKFYVDIPEIQDYFGKFIGDELPRLMKRLLPISLKREDTFIGGLSMGGYGALRNGLKYSETFGGIAALSCGDPLEDSLVNNLMGDAFAKMVFGPSDKVKNSDKCIEYLILENSKNKKINQKIFLACGLQDKLLRTTQSLKTKFLNAKYELEYHETEGGHDWDFWNSQIKNVIDWIESETVSAGISSGNVGL